MSNGTGSRDPEFPSWPPPRAMARMLSFVTAGGAATAGFLCCCLGIQNIQHACSTSLVAGVLALLSLVLNLWDFSQHRGEAYPLKKGTQTTSGSGIDTHG